MSRPAPTLPLTIYAAATGLLEPLAPTVLRRRARSGKEDPSRIAERLGRTSTPRPNGPLVWLHGVSVGESLSLLALISEIRAQRPDLALLVTSGTVTSAHVMAKRLPAGVIHQFVPLDTSAVAARFLNHWRPGAALFVESELWPNLILTARAFGVRLGLLSARMTAASATGWSRVPATARRLLQAFELILPQDADTQARLTKLGAQVGPRLNLKLVGDAPPVEAKLVDKLRAGLVGRRSVLAASTHPGEEALIAEAFGSATAAGPPSVLFVAPRHPDRGPGIATELRNLGFTVARRAAGDILGPATTAYVVDTLGELGTFYAVADLVVMGGSFVVGVGGHNPIEAARLEAAMVTGPHVFNAREIYAEMLAEKAVIQAHDAAALSGDIRGLLANATIARRIGKAANAYAGRQGAALAAAMDLIMPLLPV